MDQYKVIDMAFARPKLDILERYDVERTIKMWIDFGNRNGSFIIYECDTIPFIEALKTKGYHAYERKQEESEVDIGFSDIIVEYWGYK